MLPLVSLLFPYIKVYIMQANIYLQTSVKLHSQPLLLALLIRTKILLTGKLCGVIHGALFTYSNSIVLTILQYWAVDIDSFILKLGKILKSESEVAQSCPTLCDPMDCSPSGSSIHGTLQARVLEWGAIAFSENIDHWDSEIFPRICDWWVPGSNLNWDLYNSQILNNSTTLKHIVN